MSKKRLGSDDEPTQGGLEDPGNESNSILDRLDDRCDDELASTKGCLIGIIAAIVFWVVVFLIFFYNGGLS